MNRKDDVKDTIVCIKYELKFNESLIVLNAYFFVKKLTFLYVLVYLGHFTR